MDISTGTQSVLKLAAGWLLASALGLYGVVYNHEIRAALGFTIEDSDLVADRDRPTSPRGASEPGATPQRRADRSVEIRAGRNGHFEITALINGRPVEVLVDTGATMVALSYEDAQAAGIFLRDSDFTQRVNTANGTARVAPITLDTVTIDDITVRNVRAAVAEPGKLQTTLLGMSFLGRLGRTEMSRGVLILQE